MSWTRRASFAAWLTLASCAPNRTSDATSTVRGPEAPKPAQTATVPESVAPPIDFVWRLADDPLAVFTRVDARRGLAVGRLLDCERETPVEVLEHACGGDAPDAQALLQELSRLLRRHRGTEDWEGPVCTEGPRATCDVPPTMECEPRYTVVFAGSAPDAPVIGLFERDDWQNTEEMQRARTKRFERLLEAAERGCGAPARAFTVIQRVVGKKDGTIVHLNGPPQSDRYPGSAPLGEGNDAFQVYLNRIHGRLHPHFADGFLVSLDGEAGHDAELHATVWLVIDGPSGELVSARLLRSSGSARFDEGVLSSVRAAFPVPAPAIVRSFDGRVYLSWQLNRNPYYACTTYFARPAIYREPPLPEGAGE